jgi:hypothetical protein
MLVFRNPGLIDMAVVKTMGVNVKESDTAIGYFGTGLKFAIATILRGGGAIEIWRGPEVYRLGVLHQDIRGKEFDIVSLNGEALGYTTTLGKNWLAWMAFRELATNCIDEGGTFAPGDADTAPCGPDETMIVVNCPDIMAAYDKDDILISGNMLASNAYAEIYEGPSRYVYYRGVRVYELSVPARFKYNIVTSIRLSEDRSAAWLWEVHNAIELAIQHCGDAAVIRDAVTCGEEFYEDKLSIGGSGSAQFMETVGELALGRANHPGLNSAALAMARETAIKEMTPSHSVKLSEMNTEKLRRAKLLLTGAGFDIAAFPMVIVDTLGNGALGLASDGKMFISMAAFDAGARELAATIFEEFAHLRSGHADCSRAFQNWIIDAMLNQIEIAAGETF